MKKIILLIVLTMFSCSQWRVTSLKSKQVAFIENGSNPGQVLIKTDEFGFEDLSISVGIYNGKICTVDNVLKRIQLVYPDGDVDLVIGAIKNIDKKKIDAFNFNFNIIGLFTMDDDDNIYVQNRLKNIRRYDNKEEMDYSPSYILVFNKKGELQYTLGQKGTPDIPFSHIESLDVDSKGRLFVVSRSFDVWSVFRFSGKTRNFFVNLGKLEFEEREGQDIYKGKIENIKMYDRGDKLLLSVAYYHGLRLKYLKVFDYSIEKMKIERTILTIPDPKNVLFNIVDDKFIYFWNVSNNEVKFIICNFDGNMISNIYLKIDNKKNYYSKIIANSSGKIYSYHVTKKGIKILQWE